MLVRADGSGDRLVVRAASVSDIDWSPDGRSLLFQSQDVESVPDPNADPDSDIFIADGRGVRRLVATGRDEMAGQFGPDGAVYFFLSRYPGGVMPMTPEGWYRLDPVTGRETVLTLGDSRRVSFAPPGSPAGNRGRVAFLDGSKLYVAKSGDPFAERVAPAAEVHLMPEWSGDSDTIFFSAAEGLGPFVNHTQIYRLDFGGAAPTPITNFGWGTHAHDPDWTNGSGRVPPPAPDLAPPTLVLTDGAGAPVSSTGVAASARGQRTMVIRRRSAGFFAFDTAGVARVQIALARRGAPRRTTCRFVRSDRSLSPPRNCAKPLFVSLADAARWRAFIARVPKGDYQLALRTTDKRGNRTRALAYRPVTVR